MSLEAAILEHAAAVRELAAALHYSAQPNTIIIPKPDTPNTGTAKPIAGKATGKASAKTTEPETKAAEPEAQAEPEAPAAEDEAAATDVSVDEAAAKVTALVGAGHRPAVVALLAKYDAKRVSEIDAGKLAAFFGELGNIG